jgi:type IV pilus assembly protein PilC
VIAVSKFTTGFYPVFILGAIVSFILYKRLKKTEQGIKVIDKIKLKIPIIGPIIVLSTLDEVSRTLSLLISSGTSIIESLEVVANVANNYWYKSAMISTRTLVEKGIALSDALASTKIFPPMLIQMAKVGESTGKIDDSLYKASEYFERDLDIRIKTLTTAIEPILIIVLGVSVGFLILSIITPIYGLISQIQ